MILPTRFLPLAALSAAAVLLLPVPAGAKPKPPTVPADIAVPAGHKVFASGHAVGVQIYGCNGTAWSLTAPRADLFNPGGKLKMIHFGGPTWQHKDGSSVVGQLVKSVPAPKPTTIPWLLLSAKSTAPGAFGAKLTKTAYIQRVNTTGGLAPAASECNASTAGATREVPYTADYYFWKAKDKA